MTALFALELLRLCHCHLWVCLFDMSSEQIRFLESLVASLAFVLFDHFSRGVFGHHVLSEPCHLIGREPTTTSLHVALEQFTAWVHHAMFFNDMVHSCFTSVPVIQ